MGLNNTNFPSWSEFNFSNSIVATDDRKSKFLFHYDEDNVGQFYDAVMESEAADFKTVSKSGSNVKYEKEAWLKPGRYSNKKQKNHKSDKEIDETDYIGKPRNKLKRKKIRRKKVGRRKSSQERPMFSIMHSMLDFLSKPGDFFSNLKSMYAGGEVSGYKGGSESKYTESGNKYKGTGSSYNGNANKYKGGGGNTASSNSPTSGILAGLSSVVGDTTLSRKVYYMI